jgi:hypothetical protein
VIDFNNPRVLHARTGVVFEGPSNMVKASCDPGGHIPALITNWKKGTKVAKPKPTMIAPSARGRHHYIGTYRVQQLMGNKKAENKKKRRADIAEIERQLPSAKKIGTSSDMRSYIVAHRDVDEELLKFYDRDYWLRLKWRTKQRRDRWADNFVTKIVDEFGRDDAGNREPLVLLWGRGMSNAHLIGIKGAPPAPQAALMRKVAQSIPVVVVSERNTTRDCSFCGEVLKAYKIPNDDNPSFQRAGPNQEKKSKKRKSSEEVRGLRYCDSASCMQQVKSCMQRVNESQNSDKRDASSSSAGPRYRLVNRDFNAAVNIGALNKDHFQVKSNWKLMYHGTTHQFVPPTDSVQQHQQQQQQQETQTSLPLTITNDRQEL